MSKKSLEKRWSSRRKQRWYFPRWREKFREDGAAALERRTDDPAAG